MDFIPNSSLACVFYVGQALVLSATSSLGNVMSDQIEYRVVQRTPQSELEQFASWFHQDWKVLFGTADDAIRAYLANMPRGRRTELESELAAFLREHQASDDRKLLEAWYALGAQGWQVSLDLRTVLRRIADGRD